MKNYHSLLRIFLIRLSELFVEETTQAASYFAYYRGDTVVKPEDFLVALRQIHDITDVSTFEDD